jgi:hypothetical protein
MNWLEQFTENYYGRSAQAKELEQYLKQNYNGSSYIPWATMERLVYMQDPDAEFRIRPSLTEFSDGNIVWTSSTDITTHQKTDTKEVATQSQSIAHMIILELTFLGKTFEEVYPIQDNTYKSPKVIDANLVNKAIQRAKAKIASRATGLALTLYETGDLQFEEETTKVSAPAVKEKPAPAPKVEKQTKPISQEPVATSEASELAEEIKSNEAYDVGLQKINGAIIKKYGFSISREDEDLEQKLSKIDNLTVFGRTLKVQSGLPV